MDKKKNVKLKREKKPLPEHLYWNSNVVVWHKVYADLVPGKDGEVAKPAFANAPEERKALELILRELHSRCINQKKEWNEKVSNIRLETFLRTAHLDRFVSDNYMLRIINLNKSKIFNNQITPKIYVNGTNRQKGDFSTTRNEQANAREANSSTDFGTL